jgi:DNA-binding transcriptional LysR family regulator
MSEGTMDMRHLQYALASAEHRSFRRAAEVLRVQQSTVSRGVRSLEHRVGAELFERTHAGIRPTQAGERFLKEARQGIDHLRRAMQLVEALQRGEHGELTISISVPIILFGHMLERFLSEYEGVAVEVIENTTDASCASVQQRIVDIAFVAKTRADGSPRSLHLHDERMIAVLPKSHGLAGARTVKLDELRSEQFILSAGGLGPDIEGHLVRRMSKTGLGPSIRLQRVSQGNLIDMVAQGFGVTVVVGPLPCVEAYGVALVPLAGRNVVSVHATWMESNPNPALKGFLNIVQKSVRSDSAAYRGPSSL